MAREIQVRKFLRFKVKCTKMCVELICHMRMGRWKYGMSLDAAFGVTDIDVEIEVLNKTK